MNVDHKTDRQGANINIATFNNTLSKICLKLSQKNHFLCAKLFPSNSILFLFQQDTHTSFEHAILKRKKK